MCRETIVFVFFFLKRKEMYYGMRIKQTFGSSRTYMYRLVINHRVVFVLCSWRVLCMFLACSGANCFNNRVLFGFIHLAFLKLTSQFCLWCCSKNIVTIVSVAYATRLLLVLHPVICTYVSSRFRAWTQPWLRRYYTVIGASAVSHRGLETQYYRRKFIENTTTMITNLPQVISWHSSSYWVQKRRK